MENNCFLSDRWGVEPGSAVPVAELGLPVEGRKGFLVVFWKGA